MTCFDTGWAALLNVELWVKWANIATPIIAVLAIGAAIKQIRTAKEESKRAIAHAAYDRYLDLCFENVNFSGGYDTTSTSSVDDKEHKQYLWFVSKMLFAFEQVLDVYPNDQEWSKTIKNQLKRHRSHLSISGTVNRNEWSASLSLLIQEATERSHENATTDVTRAEPALA